MWLMYDILHFTVFVTVSFPQQLDHGTVNIVLYIYHVQTHPAETCHGIYVTAAYKYHSKNPQHDNVSHWNQVLKKLLLKLFSSVYIMVLT